jgi:4-hydroxy-tetrahydrodipicolinate reductase
MIQLAIVGAMGRTGSRVLHLALSNDLFHVVAAITSSVDGQLGQVVRLGSKQVTVTDRLNERCDVLIDFSAPAGTLIWLRECQTLGIPMVIGTTGHNGDAQAIIDEAAMHIPIVKAANFSLGVLVLTRLAAQLARELSDDFDIEIVETHHRNKVDAPSGTALAVVDEILNAMGGESECKDPKPVDSTNVNAKSTVIFGRHGQTGARPRRQIAVHAVRMGDVVGQHEIHFSGTGETFTIRHAAHSRDAFAQGALKAAAWLVGRGPGLYGMSDVFDSTDLRDD